MNFKMRTPVFPGDAMTFSGRVAGTAVDAAGCHWVDLEVAVSVAGKVHTEGRIRIALPADDSDNPWRRKGAEWKP
jgi:hypothetical protein